MTARRAERHKGNHEDSRHEVLMIKVFGLRIFLVLEKIRLFEFFRFWKKFGFMEKILFKNFHGFGKNSVI